jgi:D-alanyl-D-alanine carboxypeptidase (penicillin-binding protein 5/6)
MKIRDLFAGCCALFLSACGSPSSSNPKPSGLIEPSVPAQPSSDSIRAESYLVVETVTGRILAEKNARTPRAVASTQKLLTALCVLRAGSLEDPVTVVNSDTQVEPSKIGISAGETYTRRQLLKALLVRSGNDVARALARDVSGSQMAFVDNINRTAASLGMKNSNFLNAHGLTVEGQYSTAFDLAILAREVTKVPFFRECMRTREFVFQYGDGRTKKLENTNKVLKRYPYCTGMKTGYTRASGRCLVSSGVLNGKAVIVVALGSTSAEIWNDSEKLLRRYLEG